MLKFIQTHEASRDCTAPYDVQLDKPYTVAEFIREILVARPNEWGKFYVRRKGSDWMDRMAVIEYRYGKMESRDGEKLVIPEEFATLSIKEVEARGGYTAMDYDLIID